jgi:hypothetical protein
VVQIEDLKRWHWVVISLVIGVVLSSLYASTAAEGGPGERRTIGPGEFLARLGQTTRDKSGQDLPLIRNVRVFPAVEGKQVVTLEEMVINVERDTRVRTGEYQPRQFVAEIPFALAGRRVSSEGWTIVDELNQLNRRFEFTYVAWASQPAVYAIGVGGSFLLIGILWPTLLQRLQSAGLGAAPKAERATDLSIVRSRPSAPARTAPTGPTAQDLEQLAEVTSQYERNVADFASRAPAENVGGAADATAASSGDRKWDAAPLEQTTSAEARPQEHDYRGEFYPVDRVSKKKE